MAAEEDTVEVAEEEGEEEVDVSDTMISSCPFWLSHPVNFRNDELMQMVVAPTRPGTPKLHSQLGWRRCGSDAVSCVWGGMSVCGCYLSIEELRGLSSRHCIIHVHSCGVIDSFSFF